MSDVIGDPPQYPRDRYGESNKAFQYLIISFPAGRFQGTICRYCLNVGGRCPMQTIALLTISNIFMTFAWYGHLKYKDLRLDLAFSHVYFR